MRRILIPLLQLLLGASTATADNEQLLVLGNSYTAGNDLAGVVQSMLESTGLDVRVERNTPGGYRLPQHLADVDGANGQVAEWMTPGNVDWSYVILQDQSQVPGFFETTPAWVESRDATVALHERVGAVGAETVLFLTWGRRLGDSTNPQVFPDFSTMQDRLTDGYLTFAEAAAAEERPVYIAPVGEAWRIVHDDIVAGGGDPTADDTLFSRLYTGDGSHPSQHGTVLAGFVFAAALVGLDPDTVTEPFGLDPADLATLRDAARRAVLEDDSGRFLFPYRAEDGDDDDDAGDDDDAKDDDDVGGGPGSVTADCGCHTSRGGSPWAPLLLLPLSALRRARSRGPRP